MKEYAAGFFPGSSGDLAVSSIPPSFDKSQVQTRVDSHNETARSSRLFTGDYVVLEREVGEWRVSEQQS